MSARKVKLVLFSHLFSSRYFPRWRKLVAKVQGTREIRYFPRLTLLLPLQIRKIKQRQEATPETPLYCYFDTQGEGYGTSIQVCAMEKGVGFEMISLYPTLLGLAF